MVKSIYDLVTNDEVLNYARALRPTRYFGLELFKPRSVSEINYSYIKSAGGQSANIMAEVVAWESKAPIVPRSSIARVEGELPPIKQMSVVSERELVKLLSPRISAEERSAVDGLYNDISDRVDGVFSALNWIIMQSLGNGEVVFTSEQNKLTVDWAVPAGHKNLAPAKFWTDPTADIMGDIVTQQDALSADGAMRPDTAITSTKVITNMLKNTAIKGAIFGSLNTAAMLTLPQMNAFFAGHGLPQVYAYDDVVRKVNANLTLTTSRYFPETQFVMFNSNEILGETLFGPTAEGLVGKGAEEAPGIWAEIITTSNPVSVFTYASAVAFPTFPASDTISIIKAIA